MVVIQARERDGVVLLDIAGDMTGDTRVLHQEIEKILAGANPGVVLNLQNASYINSSWLGAIIQTFATLKKAGGRLKLVNVPPRVMELFVLTKLSVIFDIFTSEDDVNFIAVWALRKPGHGSTRSTSSRARFGNAKSRPPSTAATPCWFACRRSRLVRRATCSGRSRSLSMPLRSRAMTQFS
jgi:anti-sigma B factor antagonist